MYRIINANSGDNIGIVDAVNYIKVSDNGSYTPATKEDATGVAVNSVPYDLIGHDDIGSDETVIVSEFDGGAYIAEQQSILDDLLINMLEG